jgi:hypothetical protein
LEQCHCLASAVPAGLDANAVFSTTGSNFRLQWVELASLPLLALDQLTWNEPMPKYNPLPPLERLEELFEIDANGRLLYKQRPHPRSQRRAGDEAGTVHSTGYRVVQVNKCFYKVHRIIWALFYKEDLAGFQVDHINGNKLDNRPCNLRRCNNAQNSLNRNLTPKNKSGIKGVCFISRTRSKPWVAQYRQEYLGCFATKEEAAKALADAVKACDDREFYRAGD